MIKELKTGDFAPEFCLPDKDENEVCLKDYLGKWLILYFYPKDNTKGCTLEAIDFSNFLEEIKQLEGDVVGISPDAPKSHCKFYDKHNLNVTLLSDTEKKVLELYGVWQLKKMYGREYMGVVRSTFLIDPEGKIVQIWKKVRVKDHVKKVIEELKAQATS